jgi:hypothetical protein
MLILLAWPYADMLISGNVWYGFGSVVAECFCIASLWQLQYSDQNLRQWSAALLNQVTCCCCFLRLCNERILELTGGVALIACVGVVQN